MYKKTFQSIFPAYLLHKKILVGEKLFTYFVVHMRYHLKFIYSQRATKFCKIFTVLLSPVVPVKSKVKILQNFVAFSGQVYELYLIRGYLKQGGQVVIWRTAATALPPGGAFYSGWTIAYPAHPPLTPLWMVPSKSRKRLHVNKRTELLIQ